jgi:hypothetical protein
MIIRHIGSANSTTTWSNGYGSSTASTDLYEEPDLFYNYTPIVSADQPDDEIDALIKWIESHKRLAEMWFEALQERWSDVVVEGIKKMPTLFRKILRCNRRGLGLRLREG